MTRKIDFATHEQYLAYYREYRAKNREKIREYNLHYNRKWREKFGMEHDRARSLVAGKIKRGEIVRQPCEKCGEKAQAHHEDYYKPLEIMWLCPVHHKEKHISTSGSYPHHFTSK